LGCLWREGASWRCLVSLTGNRADEEPMRGRGSEKMGWEVKVMGGAGRLRPPLLGLLVGRL
jgi:hypothetical protein